MIVRNIRPPYPDPHTLPYTMVIPTLTLDKREGIQVSSQECIIKNYSTYFLIKIYLVGTQKEPSQ